MIPSVDTLIVKTALPGWTPVSDSVLNLTVAGERRAMSAATTHTVEIGVDGWAQGNQSLIVVLLSFPNGDVPGNFRARDEVIGACGAASKHAPRNLHTYSLITGSTEAQCSGTTSTGGPVEVTVMSWQKKNIFALVIGNRFTTTALERFAVSQDAALPGDGSTPAPIVGDSSSSSSSNRTGEIVGVLILIAVVGAIVFLLIARSRAKMPAPVQALSGPPGATPYSPFSPSASAPVPVPAPGAAPPGSPYARPEPQPQPSPSPFATNAPAPAAAAAAAPGWQPIDGDPTRIAYWDGTAYTAWKRWDGSNWID